MTLSHCTAPPSPVTPAPSILKSSCCPQALQMDYPVEVVANIADNVAQSKYFDRIYDAVAGPPRKPSSKRPPTISDAQRPKGDSHSRRPQPIVDHSPSRYDPDEESSHSERVLREYEAERDDPSRKPSASLVAKSVGLRLPSDKRRDSVGMSQANPGYGRSERGTSQRGGGARQDDYYDDEYESDYDDRTGRRTRATGRGYDSERDREFDREIIETERYRGVSLAVSPSCSLDVHSNH